MDINFGRISSLFNNFWYRKTYGGFFPFVDETEALILEKLFNIYMSRWDYENLPDELQSLIGTRNFIDGQLFFQPAMAWFKDSKLGILCLPTSGEYKYNTVGRPVEWTCWGYNGEEWRLTDKNSVIMFNDEAMSIPYLQLRYEISFMREADMTARQNLIALRQPYFIETDDDTLKSAQSIFDQLKEFKPVIFKRKCEKRNPEPIETKVFQTGVQNMGKELDDIYTMHWNRCLSYLGINNIGVQDKKERLVVAETTGNDMLIQIDFTSAIDQRQRAIDKVNKLFGTNIKITPKPLKTIQTAINSAYSELVAQGQAKGVQNDNGEQAKGGGE